MLTSVAVMLTPPAGSGFVRGWICLGSGVSAVVSVSESSSLLWDDALVSPPLLLLLLLLLQLLLPGAL